MYGALKLFDFCNMVHASFPRVAASVARFNQSAAL